MPLPEEYN